MSNAEQTEFVRLVARMRQRQREWFSTRPENRSQELLSECKRLERQVDKILKEANDRQGRLFV